MTDPVLEIIKKRRSIRSFTDQPVSQKNIEQIIEAAQWAPSGKNNQPWRFLVLTPDEQLRLSQLTVYQKTMQAAQTCIAVFLYHPSCYNRDRDFMGMGACIQNMLLTAESLGIGSLWLGEILNKKEEATQQLKLSDDYELAAVIALGYPNEQPQKDRIPFKNLFIR